MWKGLLGSPGYSLRNLPVIPRAAIKSLGKSAAGSMGFPYLSQVHPMSGLKQHTRLNVLTRFEGSWSTVPLGRVENQEIWNDFSKANGNFY